MKKNFYDIVVTVLLYTMFNMVMFVIVALMLAMNPIVGIVVGLIAGIGEVILAVQEIVYHKRKVKRIMEEA